jgi:DNA-binding transcriptional ArsR family regulator
MPGTSKPQTRPRSRQTVTSGTRTQKAEPRTRNPEAGRFAYENLDRTLHERARLGIMTSLLARREGRLFVDLRELCGLTDGNLSRHLDVLRHAGLIEIWKGFDRHRPQTLCRLSAEGTRRFVAYLEALQRVCRDAAPHTSKRARPKVPAKGWTRG